MENIHTTFDKIYSRAQKESVLKQKAKVIWFTGYSGSGKTTLASALEQQLFERGYFCQVLDGDNVRSGINNNLGFSEADRLENIRRIAEVCKLFLNSGIITICAFISPTHEIRNLARTIIGDEDFLEIWVSTPLEICEQRDTKGLYAKARKGLIKDFTGINAPFEEPQNALIAIDTANTPLNSSLQTLLSVLEPKIKPTKS